MTHLGWLKEEKGDRSWDALARDVLARLPSPDVRPRSFSTRLSKSDTGERPASWWRARPAYCRALADELSAPWADVMAWVNAADHRKGDLASLGGLGSIGEVDLTEPPDWLWPPGVYAIARPATRRQLFGHRPLPPRFAGWFTAAPGPSKRWLRSWFADHEWRVLNHDQWEEACPRLETGDRALVVLRCPRALDALPPKPPDLDCVVVVASPTALPSAGSAAQEGWHDLDRRRSASATELFSWFSSRSRLADALDREGFLEFAGLHPELGPGELLVFLEHSTQPDPARAFLASHPELDGELLDRVEEGALASGCGLARTLETWRRLVPAPAGDEALIQEIKRAARRNNLPHINALLAGRPDAIVKRMQEIHLLCPVPAGDGTWTLWPRWVARSLRRDAARRGHASSADIGAALLAESEIADEAWTALEALAARGAFEELLQRAETDGQSPNHVAATEGVALAIGHRILDGGDVPREIVERAGRALARVRGAGRLRLLTHGEHHLSEAATLMAEWALGLSPGGQEHGFAPWLRSEDLSARLQAIDDALNRWSGHARGHDSWASPTPDALRLAQRALRLGTRLYQAVGLLPPAAGEHRIFWPFQVPALLIDASRNEQVLPGKTTRQVLDEREVDAEQVFALTAQEPDLTDGDALLEYGLAYAAKGLAEISDDAQLREQAITAVIREVALRFKLVQHEVKATGGSFHESVRWLWSHWIQARHPYDIPAVVLLKRGQLDDAALVWRNAPPEVPRAIWEEASRHDGLWEILEPAGWLAWGMQGLSIEEGWRCMPNAVLRSLLGRALPLVAFEVAWRRMPGETLAWLQSQLPDQAQAAAAALSAVPSRLVPDVLDRVGLALPDVWLQRVVSRRADGWRTAWGLLDSKRAR